jgi:hypothetical protein
MKKNADCGAENTWINFIFYQVNYEAVIGSHLFALWLLVV